MNILKRIFMSPTDRAFLTLKGYCSKHIDCFHGCQFHGKDGCIFQCEEAPEDWKHPKKELNTDG